MKSTSLQLLEMMVKSVMPTGADMNADLEATEYFHSISIVPSALIEFTRGRLPNPMNIDWRESIPAKLTLVTLVNECLPITIR